MDAMTVLIIGQAKFPTAKKYTPKEGSGRYTKIGHLASYFFIFVFVNFQKKLKNKP